MRRIAALLCLLLLAPLQVASSGLGRQQPGQPEAYKVVWDSTGSEITLVTGASGVNAPVVIWARVTAPERFSDFEVRNASGENPWFGRVALSSAREEVSGLYCHTLLVHLSAHQLQKSSTPIDIFLVAVKQGDDSRQVAHVFSGSRFILSNQQGRAVLSRTSQTLAVPADAEHWALSPPSITQHRGDGR